MCRTQSNDSVKYENEYWSPLLDHNGRSVNGSGRRIYVRDTQQDIFSKVAKAARKNFYLLYLYQKINSLKNVGYIPGTVNNSPVTDRAFQVIGGSLVYVTDGKGFIYLKNILVKGKNRGSPAVSMLNKTNGGELSIGDITVAYTQAYKYEERKASLFSDKKFKFHLADGLGLAKSGVEARFHLSGRNIISGVVIKHRKKSWSQKGGYYVAGNPSSNVVRGLSQEGGFAGALKPIEGAKALAISVDRWTGDSVVTSAHSVSIFNSLSVFVDAPVVVSGRRVKNIYIFNGEKNYENFTFK